jgi:ABC exporter DevB family membrane fusion protein
VASLGTISRVVVATGRVEPATEVVLANKIPGRIKTVLVREGDVVEVGQPVVVFDDQEYQTQVRMAEARVVTARADVARAERALDAARARWLEIRSGARAQEIERARADLDAATRRQENAERERARARQLLDGDFIARSQYDATATEAEVARARTRAAEEALSLLRAGPKPEAVEAAWARVQEAQADLRRTESQVAAVAAELAHARAVLRTTVLTSSIEGTVSRRLVEPGEAVDIGIPLLVVGDTRAIIVRAEVDETDVGKLELGQRADVTADAYPGRVFPGKVVEIGQAVGKRKIRPDDPRRIQDMKVLETKVEIVDGRAELKLGMTMDVRIVSVYKPDVVVLPRALVPAAAGEALLEVLGAAGPERRRVTLGLRDDLMVEIVDGLRPGERIVRTGDGR